MAFDEFLHHVDDSGGFQILMTTLFMILSILTAPHDFVDNFTAAIPARRCRVHLDNPKSDINITINLTMEALVRVSIPMGPDQKPEQCRRFSQLQWQLLDPDAPVINNTELETEPCLDGWTCDHSVFTSTIVTEWDLVCDFQSFKYYVQAISFAGLLMGTAVSGLVSDRFGRKPLLVFPLSTSVGAFQNNSLTLVLELTSQKCHSMVIILLGLAVSAGQAMLGGLAYLLPEWHKLQLALVLPCFIFSCFLCWVPESIRWLMVNGKRKQALKELQGITSISGKKDVTQNLTTEILQLNIKEDMNAPRNQFRIKDIFINPTVRKTVLCTSGMVFAEFFSVYGLLLDIQTLGKDIFLTQFLLGMIDMPSKTLTFFVLRHVQRCPSVAFLLLTLGSFTIFISEEMHVLRLLIFLLGKASFSAFTAVMIVFSSELSPTVLRSTLQAIVIAVRYFVHLPMILYGVLPIVATINIYFMPETFNLPLSDTIKDMEKRDRLMNKSISEKQKQDLLETTEC
uniref:Solute carrier family 22 (organic cation transporter), member 22 n=1 Tax=Nannospalax galili TaxID=1026970 RepID=A0A8C6QRX4_NANGA